MGGGAEAARGHGRPNREQLPAVVLDANFRDGNWIEGRFPGGRKAQCRGWSDTGRGPGPEGHFGKANHLLEGSDPADGVLREGEGVRHGAEQPPVHIDRAPAHPLNDPGVGERTTRQVREHDAAAWHRALQHSDDLHREGLHLLARKDGAAFPHHPRPHFVERQDGGLGGGFRCEPGQYGEQARPAKVGSQGRILERRNATARVRSSRRIRGGNGLPANGRPGTGLVFGEPRRSATPDRV